MLSLCYTLGLSCLLAGVISMLLKLVFVWNGRSSFVSVLVLWCWLFCVGVWRLLWFFELFISDCWCLLFIRFADDLVCLII